MKHDVFWYQEDVHCIPILIIDDDKSSTPKPDKVIIFASSTSVPTQHVKVEGVAAHLKGCQGWF